MKNNFRKLTGTVWAKLDNPIKSSTIFQSFDLFLVCCPLRRHSATICDVTTVQQLSNGNYGAAHKFHKILLFRKMYLPPTFTYAWLC